MPSDDFEMTQDEMVRIKEAMKNEEFMKMLVEYANELEDPENKKKYEDEIIAMEKQRGHDVKLLSPQSGFVVKTERLSDGLKVFLNICTSPEIAECSLNSEIRDGKKGTHVLIPHSLAPGRDDTDKAGKPCFVYDVCFNPKTYTKATDDIKFRTLLIDSAFDTLENKTNTKLDRKKKRFPKMKYKGMKQTNILRSDQNQVNDTDAMPMDEKTKEVLDLINDSKKDLMENGTRHKDVVATTVNTGPTAVTPDYKIVHRGYFDMQNFTYSRAGNSSVPKELVVEIKLPLAKSAAGIDLDIFEKEVILDSKDPTYHLEISLPYPVNEANGQAQFDTSEQVLRVTLPVIKPETQFDLDLTPEPSIVDVTPAVNNQTRENGDVNGTVNGNTKGLFKNNDLIVPSAETKNQSTGAKAKEKQANTTKNELNEPEENESLSSMLLSGMAEETTEVNEKIEEDDTVMVDMETVREHLENNLANGPENKDIEFDTSNFECFRPSSKLPLYCYSQAEDQINLTISIPDVKVVYLSLGFSEQQAYMSYPRNPDDANSPNWELVIRLDEDCFLDNDNCGVDVTEKHMELILRKRIDSMKLWEKFFVGLSESSLKVELFNTESIAENMLKCRNGTSETLDMSDVIAKEGDSNPAHMEKKLTHLESRLSQLLQSQEESERFGDIDEDQTTDKTSMNFKDSNGYENKENTENGEDGNVCAKLNGVIINEKNDKTTKEPLKNGNVNANTENEPSANGNSRQLYGRSLSLGNESSYEGEKIIHSILKHSKSDSDYYCETEEDEDYSCSANSFSDSIFSESPATEPTPGRRRIKSVTFNDEPIIFEFAKLSKRQIKKQMKEERLRLSRESKGIFSKLSQSAPAASNSGVTTETEQSKGKSRKKDKCEKKGRSYSDGFLQVPNSILARHKQQKKKKKNKKNRNDSESESPGGSLTDLTTSHTEDTTLSAATDDVFEKPMSESDRTALNNGLIFELE